MWDHLSCKIPSIEECEEVLRNLFIRSVIEDNVIQTSRRKNIILDQFAQQPRGRYVNSVLLSCEDKTH